MNKTLIQLVGSSRASLVQVKNTVLESNMLELKAIERYRQKHPSMSINQAAMSWIAKNAARWRMNHVRVHA